MGDFNSSRAKSLSRAMLPFFSHSEVHNVWDIEVGTALKGADFSIQRVSQNLARSICAGQSMWWIGKDFSEKEQAAAVMAGVSFASHWWAMMNNRIPEFLPLPDQGILNAGDRAPSQKTLDFAKGKNLPLISVKETGGFMVEFVKGEWGVKVR